MLLEVGGLWSLLSAGLREVGRLVLSPIPSVAS
jgi:hypothetical protein